LIESLRELDSVRELHAFADTLRASVAEHHGRVRVSHGGFTLTGDYAALYVEPNRRGPHDQDDDGDDHRLREAVRHMHRCVILGAPGSGKSTFVHKLAHDLAAALAEPGHGLVPLLLAVREHTTSLREDHETMLHYLRAVARRPHQLEPPPGALEYLLLNGRAVVIIDGMDELGESQHRFATVLAHTFGSLAVQLLAHHGGFNEHERAALDELYPALAEAFAEGRRAPRSLGADPHLSVRDLLKLPAQARAALLLLLIFTAEPCDSELALLVVAARRGPVQRPGVLVAELVGRLQLPEDTVRLLETGIGPLSSRS
jgi:hypothetical protein